MSRCIRGKVSLIIAMALAFVTMYSWFAEGNILDLMKSKEQWKPYYNGFRWDDNMIFIESTVPSSIYGAVYILELNQERPEPVYVSVESMSQDVSGTLDSDYVLALNIAYVDGSYTFGIEAKFDTGTHDWQKVQLKVPPVGAEGKPIKSVAIFLIFRGQHTGRVWFRNAIVSIGEEPFSLSISVSIPRNDLEGSGEVTCML